MLDSLDASAIDAGYLELEPDLRLGLPFKQLAVSEHWFDWPTLPDLFPVSFQGVQTGRDVFLVDTDLERLQARIGNYFDVNINHEEMARRYPRVMKDTGRFDARAVRDTLLARGGPNESGLSAMPIVRSTTGGFTGKRRRNCCVRRALATRSMYLRVTCGWLVSRNHVGIGRLHK